MQRNDGQSKEEESQYKAHDEKAGLSTPPSSQAGVSAGSIRSLTQGSLAWCS